CTAGLSGTPTAGGTGVSGKSVSFSVTGTGVGSAVTDGSGVATLSAVSLSGIGAGTYPSGVAASFAEDGGYGSSDGTASLTVDQADQTITFTNPGTHTFGDPDFQVNPTSDSGLTVSVAAGASDQCTLDSATAPANVHITGG